MAAGRSAQGGNIRVERVPSTKLSPAQYSELCLILARVPRNPLVLGKGRQPRVATSYSNLARMFGVSQPRISQIARDVRQGRANTQRAFGLRAVELAPKTTNAHGGKLQSYERGIGLPSPSPGLPAIVRPVPGGSMLAVIEAVAEGRLSLF